MKCFKFSCSYEVFFFVFVYLKHIFHSIIVALLTVSVFCYHSVTTTCFTDFLVHSLCDINNKYILLPQYRFIVVDLIRTNLIVYQKIKKKRLRHKFWQLTRWYSCIDEELNNYLRVYVLFFYSLCTAEVVRLQTNFSRLCCPFLSDDCTYT